MFFLSSSVFQASCGVDAVCLSIRLSYTEQSVCKLLFIRLHIPSIYCTYFWTVLKPKTWSSNIQVDIFRSKCGFFSLLLFSFSTSRANTYYFQQKSQKQKTKPIEEKQTLAKVMTWWDFLVLIFTKHSYVMFDRLFLHSFMGLVEHDTLIIIFLYANEEKL